MSFSCKFVGPLTDVFQFFLAHQNSRLGIHRLLLNCRHYYLGKDFPVGVQLGGVGQEYLLVTERTGKKG